MSGNFGKLELEWKKSILIKTRDRTRELPFQQKFLGLRLVLWMVEHIYCNDVKWDQDLQRRPFPLFKDLFRVCFRDLFAISSSVMTWAWEVFFLFAGTIRSLTLWQVHRC